MIEAYYQPDVNDQVQILTDLAEIENVHKRAVQQQDPRCKLWITLRAASQEELNWLHDQLHLHPLVIEDIKGRNQRSKLDEYKGYLFTVLHRPFVDPKTKEIEWEELHIVIGKHWIVTSIDEGSLRLTKIIDHLSSDANLFDKGLGALVYHLCDGVVDAFFPIIDNYDDQMDDIEDDLFTKPEQSLLDQMFVLKRNLVEMRRYLAPQRDVFRMMLDRSEQYFDDQARLYFRDIYDHNVRVYDMLDTLRDQVGNATDLYLSVVNNNMNQVMKRLTIITTIFMPITFVTGVFGMNFGHSPQVEFDPGWFFWAALVAMAVIASFMVYVLKRSHLT